jgi:hypothetical protein
MTAVRQTQQPPAAALGSVPRDVALTGAGAAVAVLAAALAVAALVLGVWLSIFAKAIPVWVGPFVGTAVAAIAWMLTYRLHSDWRLLSEARAVEGTVVGNKRTPHQHGHTERVTYQFTTLAGATIQGRAEVGGRAPAVGDRVTVIYHRDDPHWNALYPLALVKSARR